MSLRPPIEERIEEFNKQFTLSYNLLVKLNRDHVKARSEWEKRINRAKLKCSIMAGRFQKAKLTELLKNQNLDVYLKQQSDSKMRKHEKQKKRKLVNELEEMVDEREKRVAELSMISTDLKRKAKTVMGTFHYVTNLVKYETLVKPYVTDEVYDECGLFEGIDGIKNFKNLINVADQDASDDDVSEQTGEDESDVSEPESQPEQVPDNTQPELNPGRPKPKPRKIFFAPPRRYAGGKRLPVLQRTDYFVPFNPYEEDVF